MRPRITNTSMRPADARGEERRRRAHARAWRTQPPPWSPWWPPRTRAQRRARRRGARPKWRQRAATVRRWPAGILFGRRASRRRDHVRSPRSDRRLPQLARRRQRRASRQGGASCPGGAAAPQGGPRRSGPRSRARRAAAPAHRLKRAAPGAHRRRSAARGLDRGCLRIECTRAQGVVAAQARRRVTSSRTAQNKKAGAPLRPFAFLSGFVQKRPRSLPPWPRLPPIAQRLPREPRPS